LLFFKLDQGFKKAESYWSKYSNLANCLILRNTGRIPSKKRGSLMIKQGCQRNL